MLESVENRGNPEADIHRHVRRTLSTKRSARTAPEYSNGVIGRAMSGMREAAGRLLQRKWQSQPRAARPSVSPIPATQALSLGKTSTPANWQAALSWQRGPSPFSILRTDTPFRLKSLGRRATHRLLLALDFRFQSLVESFQYARDTSFQLATEQRYHQPAEQFSVNHLRPSRHNL